MTTTPTPTKETTSTGSSMWSILKLRNVRLLWLGEAISVLGDQFHMIALPWLVLLLTNDALAVGTVLAIAGFLFLMIRRDRRRELHT